MINKDDFNTILLIILGMIQLTSLYFTIPYKIKQKIYRLINPPRKYRRKNHDIS